MQRALTATVSPSASGLRRRAAACESKLVMTANDLRASWHETASVDASCALRMNVTHTWADVSERNPKVTEDRSLAPLLYSIGNQTSRRWVRVRSACSMQSARAVPRLRDASCLALERPTGLGCASPRRPRPARRSGRAVGHRIWAATSINASTSWRRSSAKRANETSDCGAARGFSRRVPVGARPRAGRKPRRAA
jgi:hypothetical protein